VWLVDDTLLAYQELGRLWRRQLGVPVVAVTGSAGKTTTRELIRASLACLGPVVASSGNENNDVGAPLTLLKADATTRALVVEMGMRGLGEIERLSRCAEPDVAVITNIGTAHIGRLGSREAIATAKCEISAALRPDGLVVIPAGDSLLEAALAASWSGRVQRVALADDELAPGSPPADLVGRLVAPSPASDGDTERPGAECPQVERQAPERLEVEGLPPMSLPLAGRHNARNLLLALAVARMMVTEEIAHEDHHRNPHFVELVAARLVGGETVGSALHHRMHRDGQPRMAERRGEKGAAVGQGATAHRRADPGVGQHGDSPVAGRQGRA
jgi:UDP-N-acetylmuramoyl-tripeptide--D-alanyl-D-alanine ligase